MKYSIGDNVTIREGFYRSQRLKILKIFPAPDKTMYLLLYEPVSGGVPKKFWQPAYNIKKFDLTR